jgi:pSer/pThr/pTyr-binding forkhead associated (FHA) protein
VGRRYGADSGEVYPLLGERLVVGRFDPDSGPVDIDLSAAAEAANVSRHHAEVYREADGRWYVKDLGAVNGVFVKGAGSSAFGPRLTAPQALQNGDEVAFGNARFVFRTD